MDENRFDDNLLKSQGGKKLADDLQSLFEPEQADWSLTDRAIMDRAAQRLLVARRRRWIYWPVAAAATVAIVTGLLLVNFKSRPRMALSPETAKVSNDVDANGRVDILDAFKLAKMLETPAVENLQWDMNGDGTVDRRDVDVVANAAVAVRKDVM